MEVLFVNGKGGVGKSTLCYLLNLGLKEAGKSVYVRDLDPQQTLSQFMGDQEGMSEEEADIVLVDSMPVIDNEIVTEAIRKADVLIIPCSSDPFTLAVTISSSQVVKDLKKKGAKAFAVLNDVEKGTRLSLTAPDILKENLKVELLDVQIPHRQAIKRASLEGWAGLDQEVREAVFKLALEIVS